MFDIIPNFLTNLTILFAVYASHKGLSSPPSPQQTALLSPWLTYFLILALGHVLESYLPIIPSLPLYAWARLFAHIYLLLPGESQGAGYVYNRHLLPFIRGHEREIESAMAQTHDVLRDLGLGHLEELIEYVKVNVLGRPATQRDHAAEASRAPPTTNTFVAGLLGRFAAPGAAPTSGASSSAGLSALLGSALAQASSLASSTPAAAASPTSLDALVPPHLGSDRERLAYISRQREHLRTLLAAFEREEQTINLASVAEPGAGAGGSGMGRSRSEAEFETIRSEDVGDAPPAGLAGAAGRSSWGAWLGGGKGKEGGRSSGVDASAR